jgi:hypothetical protein
VRRTRGPTLLRTDRSSDRETSARQQPQTPSGRPEDVDAVAIDDAGAGAHPWTATGSCPGQINGRTTSSTVCGRGIRAIPSSEGKTFRSSRRKTSDVSDTLRRRVASVRSMQTGPGEDGAQDGHRGVCLMSPGLKSRRRQTLRVVRANHLDLDAHASCTSAPDAPQIVVAARCRRLYS